MKEPNLDRDPATTRDLVRKYAQELPELGTPRPDERITREQFAEHAFAVLYDLLAACDAAPGIPTKATLTIAQIRNLIRENIRSAA
jgi:hypothetical protein